MTTVNTLSSAFACFDAQPDAHAGADDSRAASDDFNALLAGFSLLPAQAPQPLRQNVAEAESATTTNEPLKAVSEDTSTVLGLPDRVTFIPSPICVDATGKPPSSVQNSAATSPELLPSSNRPSSSTEESGQSESEIFSSLPALTDACGATARHTLQQPSEPAPTLRASYGSGKPTLTPRPWASLSFNGFESFPSVDKLAGTRPTPETAGSNEKPLVEGGLPKAIEDALQADDAPVNIQFVSSSAVKNAPPQMKQSIDDLLPRIKPPVADASPQTRLSIDNVLPHPKPSSEKSASETPLQLSSASPAQALDSVASSGARPSPARSRLDASNMPTDFSAGDRMQTTRSAVAGIRAIKSALAEEFDDSTPREDAPSRTPAPSIDAMHGVGLVASQNFSGQAQAAAAESSSETVVDGRKVAAQLTHALTDLAAQASARHEPRTLRIRLRPEELGEVQIRITHDDKGVNAHLTVESEATRNAVSQGLGHLREALEQAGINVRQLDVSLGSHADTNAGTQAGARRNESSSATNFDSSSATVEDAGERASVNQEGRLLSIRA